MKVSVNVEREEQPRMAAGSWQGWQSWGASSSLWGEGKWDKNCQEVKMESTVSRVLKEVEASWTSNLERSLNQSIRNPRGKKMKNR